MLDKLEFGDLWKFLASIGLILLGAAVGLPYLFLRDPMGLAIKEAEFSALTPTSQQLVQSRLRFASALFQWLLPIIVALVMVGLALFIWAVLQWRTRQQVLDKLEQVDLQKKEHELSKLTQEQKVEAVVAELTQDDPARTDSSKVSRTSPIVQQYLAVEDILYQTLLIKLPFARIIKNRRLDNADFDLIVISSAWVRDAVVEVKLTKALPDFTWVQKHIERHAHRTLIYRTTVDRPARPVLLVYSEAADDQEYATLKQQATKFLQTFNVDMTVEFIPVNMVSKYDYVSILRDNTPSI